ncbi:MAG: EF-hand domain-containing protein [Paracoccaceae bacterium]|nr:EF-hand domain-containing protein [Paracoccaceae bacterium]
MKNTVFIGLVAATAIAIAGSAAMARGDRHGAPVAFETLDANADGAITPEEMQAARALRMSTVDTNGDGFLTLEELEAGAAERAKSRAGKIMERLDTNEDAKLSAEELEKPERADRRFNRVDADGDGEITKAEYDSAMSKMKKRHGHRDAD